MNELYFWFEVSSEKCQKLPKEKSECWKKEGWKITGSEKVVPKTRMLKNKPCFMIENTTLS